MLDRWFGHNTHYYLHLLGLVGVAVGLPLSKVVLSISTMFLLLNLLLKVDFKTYLENWKSSRTFVLILAFFLLHFVGLIWSENISYGLNDIWKKIPLLIIPLVATAIPFNARIDRRFVLLTFVASVMTTSVLNVLFYHQLLGDREVIEFRDMSQFGSHVRYALLVVIAIVIAYNEIIQRRMIPIALVIIGWLTFYTFYSQVIAGFLALISAFIVVLFYHFYPKRKVILIGLSALTVGLLLSIANWLFYRPNIDVQKYLSKLDRITAEGNSYTHDLTLIAPETSRPIGEYVCTEELSREWSKVSELPFDGLDKKGQLLAQTIIRYMASMELRKDAEGFASLNKRDVKKIENGCASQYCQGMIARLYGLKYQILNENNPNGHSLLQRLEYWQAGSDLLAKNFIIGLGTGDVQAAFNAHYNQTKSALTEKNRLRTHNYYITVWITFGILGIILFMWIHIEFFKNVRSAQNLIGLCFIWILLVSYLTEDTLETQVGVTFFAFFMAIFIRPVKE